MGSEGESIDIFKMLVETEEKRRKSRRAELLAPLKIQDLFEEGGITIDMNKCWGVECKICIDLCPTNALYWRMGKVAVTEELCLHCLACVLNCIVDDCIHVWRLRPDGTREEYSKPRDVLMLVKRLNSKKSVDMTKKRFPTLEAYLRRYRPLLRRLFPTR